MVASGRVLRMSCRCPSPTRSSWTVWLRVKYLASSTWDGTGYHILAARYGVLGAKYEVLGTRCLPVYYLSGTTTWVHRHLSRAELSFSGPFELCKRRCLKPRWYVERRRRLSTSHPASLHSVVAHHVSGAATLKAQGKPIAAHCGPGVLTELQYLPQLQHSQSPHHQQTRSSQHQPQPRSQVEAMPPFQPPSVHPSSQSGSSPHPQQFNSALRHPVFFTDRLRKPPFPLPGNGGASISPIAYGYVAESVRASAEAVGQTKL